MKVEIKKGSGLITPNIQVFLDGKEAEGLKSIALTAEVGMPVLVT